MSQDQARYVCSRVITERHLPGGIEINTFTGFSDGTYGVTLEFLAHEEEEEKKSVREAKLEVHRRLELKKVDGGQSKLTHITYDDGSIGCETEFIPIKEDCQDANL